MQKISILFVLLLLVVSACNNDQTTEQPAIETDSINENTEATAANIVDFPPYVVYRNWEIGDPQNTQLILNVYKAWDSDSTGDLATYISDSTIYDLPDGSRQVTTKENAESTLRSWRNKYKETTNIPFSILALYNKDLDQEWVTAWTWNKWRHQNGKLDSMLFCDNWQIRNGRVVYLNSLENRASKTLSTTINKLIAK